MLSLKQISKIQKTIETNAALRLSAYRAWCMSTFRQLLKDMNINFASCAVDCPSSIGVPATDGLRIDHYQSEKLLLLFLFLFY